MSAPASPETLSGGCRCGALRYRVSAAPRWVAHCHCADCRRSSGAPFVTWIGVLTEAFAWEGAPPATYRSSPGAERSFCATCGTPLTYRSERWPEETHILAGTLDDPEAVRPEAHVYTRHQLSWIALADGLPQRSGTTDDP